MEVPNWTSPQERRRLSNARRGAKKGLTKVGQRPSQSFDMTAATDRLKAMLAQTYEGEESGEEDTGS